VIKNYNVPSAGGDYGAPTPHAAKVAQQIYEAPTGDMTPSGGPAHAGFDAMENGLGAPRRRVTSPSGSAFI
jgi:hypothetical protein